jgi:hypothetical protein
MGLENFVPQIWSAKLFVRLQKALVFGDVVNHDYEGEIKNMGDTVNINEIGDITVSDYTKYGALTWQALTSAQKKLIIDQAKAFSFAIDDIDVVQMNPKVMNAAMDNAAYQIADTIDQFIAGLYAQAGATPSTTTYIGSSASNLSVSSGNVIETFSYAARYLTEKNVPEASRWIVIPPWMHQKLLLSEVGGIASTAVPKIATGEVIPGYVGSALGFSEIRVSNNVSCASAAGQYRVMCGNRSAISYAGQVSKIKAVEREDYFDQGVKGLYVYGAKVVRPSALLTLYVIEAAS